MAKKKETLAEQPAIEETAAEAVKETVAEKTEGLTEEQLEQVINNQLKAINRMSNKARARRLAARVLNNRKGL